MSRTKLSIGCAALAIVACGCLGRAISEAGGVVMGARGKVVDVRRPSSLSRYHGFRIESLTASRGLLLPANMESLIRGQFSKAARELGLTTSGSPMLVVSAEIIHYESGGAVDSAIGPLEEVILRTTLKDGTSQTMLAEANLVGRSKATTSSGAENLAEGAGKAMENWLKEAGVRKKGD